MIQRPISVNTIKNLIIIMIHVIKRGSNKGRKEKFFKKKEEKKKNFLTVFGSLSFIALDNTNLQS